MIYSNTNGRMESASNAGLSETESKINWPKQGTMINELVAMQLFDVYVDASFVNTPSFYGFSSLWQFGLTTYGIKRNFYIRENELKKIDKENEDRLAAPNCEVCTSWKKTGATENGGMSHAIILITANPEISFPIKNEAKRKGYSLKLYEMDSDGKLYTPLLKNIQKKQRDVKKQKENVYEKQKERIFQVTEKVAPISLSIRIPNRMPSIGSLLYREREERNTVKLKRAVMTDHISVTYETDSPSYFAKVYTIDALKFDLLEKKADRMLNDHIDIQGICWPVDKLVDSNGCFVGILVPISKGVQLSRSALAGATGLKHYFPSWDKQDLCVVMEVILDKICKMHHKGIMFGCINPASIYIENSKEVYFVDTDGWQIEGYPALSQNQTFTPPEMVKNDQKQLLYTMDQENYQVAVLTFMIMMPGKFPYPKADTLTERDSIAQMSFPFSVGGGMRRTKNSDRPSGVWRIVWDHLPYRMCESFYATFHYDGKYAKPGKRLSTEYWLQNVRNYADSLAKPERADSRKIFPRTFRKDGKRNFVKCSICGQEHPDFYFLHNINMQGEKIDVWNRGYRVCLPCSEDQSDKYFVCECCGRKLYYTNRTKILHEIGKSDFDFKNQRWCKNCKKRTVVCRSCGKETPVYQMREFKDEIRDQRIKVCGSCFKDLVNKAKQERNVWKNAEYTSRICRTCGRKFTITNGQKEYFDKKGFLLPIRCPDCRNRH